MSISHGVVILASEPDAMLSKNHYKVEVPSWRPDINQEIDIVEELIRIKGFDKIKIIAPEKVRN